MTSMSHCFNLVIYGGIVVKSLCLLLWTSVCWTGKGFHIKWVPCYGLLLFLITASNNPCEWPILEAGISIGRVHFCIRYLRYQYISTCIVHHVFGAFDWIIIAVKAFDKWYAMLYRKVPIVMKHDVHSLTSK